MSGINQDTPVEEVAALVSQALEAAGIDATLSGGGAVSIYSANLYQSRDLDFVTSAGVEPIERAINLWDSIVAAGTRGSLITQSARGTSNFRPDL